MPNVGNVQGLIDRLKIIGEEIKQLENKKQLAVDNEDYDTAKSCKVIHLLSVKSCFLYTIAWTELIPTAILFPVLTLTKNWVCNKTEGDREAPPTRAVIRQKWAG